VREYASHADFLHFLFLLCSEHADQARHHRI
jgi:hypothetical protein